MKNDEDTLQSGAESALDLMPCPFCGNAGVDMHQPSDLCFAHCDDCHAEGPGMEVESEAVAAWNRVSALARRAAPERSEGKPAPHAAQRDEQNIKAEFGEYFRWCADQGRKPMRFSAFKFAAQPVEAAGSAVQAEQVQWRNIQKVLKDVATFCFGSADDPAYGSFYTAVVTSLTAKDGLSVKLEPLPTATHPSEPVGAQVFLQGRSPEGDPWQEVSADDFIMANANGYETRIHITRPGQNSVCLKVPAVGSALVAKTGYMLMPCKLTAENGAKGALSGEFKESIEVPCHECHAEDDDYECQTCEGFGRVSQNVPVSWDTIKGIYEAAVDALSAPTGALVAVKDEQQASPELTVWYGALPESNGRSNFTAMLMRKGASIIDGGEYTFARSEYPDRVRYEADCMRHLIGELDKNPDILAYDADKHSGYVEPASESAAAPADQLDAQRWREAVRLICWRHTGEKSVWSLDLPTPPRNSSGNTDDDFVAAIDASLATHQPTTQADGKNA